MARSTPGFDEMSRGQASVATQNGACGWRTMLLLAAAALIVFTLHLDQRGDSKGDESFYLAGALAAVEDGQWLVPTYHEQVRLQKPPLHYWLVAGSYKLFGVGVWQARLPSAVAGATALIFTWWLGVLLFDSRRAGLYGACVLLSSQAFMQQAHWAMTDTPLALFTVAAFCGFAAALIRGRRWGGTLAWAATACAVMQKGPVGLLITLVPVVLWMTLVGRKNGARWRGVFSPVGMVLFLALVLPWPIAVLAKLGREEVFRRVGGEMEHHIVLSAAHFFGGVLYYAWAFIQGVFPWSLLYIYYRRRAAWPAPAIMLWIWGAFAALFFAITINMLRIRYLVPELPALALICGHALDRLQAHRAAELWAWRLFTWGVDGMLVVLAILGGCLLPSAFILIKTPTSVLVPTCMMAISLVALVLVRRFRRAAPEGAGWVVTTALGLAAAQATLLFSWNVVMPQDPAWWLAQRYLHGVPSAQITGVELSDKEQTWSWVAAGGSFRNERLPFQRPPLTRYLLIHGDRMDEISADLRGEYNTVATASGQGLNWRVFWFLGNRANALDRWRKDSGTVVLLERRHPAS